MGLDLMLMVPDPAALPRPWPTLKSICTLRQRIDSPFSPSNPHTTLRFQGPRPGGALPESRKTLGCAEPGSGIAERDSRRPHQSRFGNRIAVARAQGSASPLPPVCRMCIPIDCDRRLQRDLSGPAPVKMQRLHYRASPHLACYRGVHGAVPQTSPSERWRRHRVLRQHCA
jgi:hypothetical protein